VTFNYPTSKLTGMMMGDRKLTIEGQMTFEDTNNDLKAVVFFHPEGQFEGLFYEVKPVGTTPGKKEPTKVKELGDVAKSICEINGNWKERLEIGRQEYWECRSD